MMICAHAYKLECIYYVYYIQLITEMLLHPADYKHPVVRPIYFVCLSSGPFNHYLIHNINISLFQKDDNLILKKQKYSLG